jgi:hypothetical protein
MIEDQDNGTFRDVMDECDQAQFREALDLKQALEAQKLRREPLQVFCQACEFSHHGQQMKSCDAFPDCLQDWQKRVDARARNGSR